MCVVNVERKYVDILIFRPLQELFDMGLFKAPLKRDLVGIKVAVYYQDVVRAYANAGIPLIFTGRSSLSVIEGKLLASKHEITLVSKGSNT